MAKSKKVKKNPHVSMRRSDVERLKEACTRDAMEALIAIFLTVMHDKEGYGSIRLGRLFKEINELSETVTEGYVTIENLKKALRDECNIEIKIK